MTYSTGFAKRIDNYPALVSGLLLTLGSLFFIIGGSHHPRINSTLGPLGSEQFYQAFAAHAAHTAGWETFHTLILLGPVLWALAIPGLVAILPAAGLQIWRAASMAFAIAATAWLVTFALDGFNAPVFGRAIEVAAADPAALRDKLFEFSISSRLVAYMGRISWSMMSLSFASFAASMIFSSRSGNWRRMVGITGVLLGVWTIFELVRGDFSPAPFTSQYWMTTARATGLWVLAFGFTVGKTRAAQAGGLTSAGV